MIENRRKILMLIPELGYGGAEKSFLRLSHLLSKYHDVQIAVFQQHYAKGNYAQSDYSLTVTITILDNKKNIGRFHRWKNRWKNLKALKKDSDITISFLTGANILNASISTQSKTIVSMRGSRHFDPNFSYLKRLLYEFIIDPLTFMFSDRIISVSDGLSSELKRYVTKRTKQKIQTIEVFVNAKELISLSTASIEKEIEDLKVYPIIIGAGRLSPEKGFQYLIPIFSKVHEDIPNAKLILIGDGPQYKNLINLCKKLNLSYTSDKTKYQESAVVFLGYRKNPLRYFRIAKLFVLSSLTEGFPNGIIEALASGISVVATDCPWGPRSVLCKVPKDIKTPYHTIVPSEVDYGVLMPRIDDKKFKDLWVQKLNTILLNKKENKKNIFLGNQRVHELDISVIGKKWLDLIEELV
jgi:glycosyltransferase involved in cell wall biosynthesis